MPRILITAFIAITCLSLAKAGQDRMTLINTLSVHSGINPEVLAAAGFTASEAITALNAIENESQLPGEIETSVVTLTELGLDIAQCRSDLRRSYSFDDSDQQPSQAELETRLSQCLSDLESTQADIARASNQLRVEILSNHLTHELITRVSGQDARWARLPIHWRFSSIPEDQVSMYAVAYTKHTRLTAAGESVPSSIQDLIASIEAQYPVSLAKARLDSRESSIRQSITNWMADQP